MNLINIIQNATNNGVDLFADIVYPAALDHDTIVNTILQHCALNEPVYYDLPLFKQMINNFFLKNKETYQHLSDALGIVYIANENMARHEESTDNRTNTGTSKNTGTVKNTGTDTNTSQRSAEDAGEGWTNTDRSTDNPDLQRTDDLTRTDDLKDDNVHTAYYHGSIGVITNQDMITKEMELRQKYRIYDIIALDFYDEFMLSIID